MAERKSQKIIATTVLLAVFGFSSFGLAVYGQQSTTSQPTTTPISTTDWTAVGKNIGKPLEQKPGGVYVASFPRSDLRVIASGVRLRPAFLHISQIMFMGTSQNEAMVMGELALTQSEVAPVIKTLKSNGFDISALHTHSIGETPRIMFLHFLGHGNPLTLDKSVNLVLQQTDTPLTPTATSTPLNLNPSSIDRTMGSAGVNKGGVYRFEIPRREQVTVKGMPMPSSMDLSTIINFQGLESNTVLSSGYFVLRQNEVNPVMQILSDNNITITAVQNHLLFEQPRMIYLHFLAKGSATEIAGVLKQALNVIR